MTLAVTNVEAGGREKGVMGEEGFVNRMKRERSDE